MTSYSLFLLVLIEALARFVFILIATSWAAFVLFLVCGVPVIVAGVVLASPWFVLPTIMVIYWNVFFLGLSLYLILCGRRFIRREATLVRHVGPQHALWVEGHSSWTGRLVCQWVVADIDTSSPLIYDDVVKKTLRVLLHTPENVNYYQLSSICWSWLILKLEVVVEAAPSLQGLLLLFLISRFLKLFRGWGALLWSVLRTWLVVVLFVTLSTPPVLWATVSLFVFFFRVAGFVLLKSQFRPLHVELLILTTKFANWWLSVKFASDKFATPGGFKPRVGRKVSVLFQEQMSRLGIMIADMGLPSYVLGPRKSHYTVSDVQSTMDIMSELGWPINVSLADPSRFGSASRYANWLVSGTDWAQGVHNREMYLDHILDPLRVAAVEFRRTEEYRSLDNELESVARYFKSPNFNYPDLPLNDVWFLIGDIFKHSRLTPFNYIIRMWEKKYSLGSFMADPDRRKKKHSRVKFISSIGYSAFKQLWRRTFEVASTLAPVSHVSVKDEALPPKKWMADKVRTVVGSPLGQYIMSTVWNYWPNHNFKFDSTPIKVGMPLNGYWFDRMYSKHARCQVHIGGDFGDFDSSIVNQIQQLAAAVRKRGFDQHRDKDRIARLIDINYDQVEHQLLNTTSTGDIYSKGTGFTTGHSSTSMDNSMATIILYLLAWKKLTGLSAVEFKYFNELSCFGDDHVLSYLAARPTVWNFKNIISVMKTFGVVLRKEEEGALSAVGFLSKYVRKPTAADREDLKQAGLHSWSGWVTYHDREKLVGKLVSKVKTMAPAYRLKRLLSYLSLCAHHPDVYTQLHEIITRTNSFKGIIKNEKIKIPSYSKVLQDWYSPKGGEAHNEMSEVDESLVNTDCLVQYGSVGPVDSILSALALVPDLINPSVFNFGYLRTVQSRLCHLTSWPMELLSRANQAFTPVDVNTMLTRSVYSFLDGSIRENMSNVTSSSLLVRHWLFVTWIHFTSFPRVTGVGTAVHRKIADLQFMLNGKVQAEVRKFSFTLPDLLVVAVLGLLHAPTDLELVMAVKFPDLGLLLDNGTNYLTNLFWSNLPPNYSDVVKLVRGMTTASPALAVQAGTGTGKTTAMMKCLADNAGYKYNKIIVIEPRSLIVRTTVPFCQVHLGLDCSGSTTGLTLDTKAKVWYVTAQEFLLHTSWLDPNNLIVLDECHVVEPAYLLVKEVLQKFAVAQLWCSATLPAGIEATHTILPLQTANVWTVHRHQSVIRNQPTVREAIRVYLQNAMYFVDSLPDNSKVLIFVQTIKDANEFANKFPGKAAVLSSGSDPALLGGSKIIVSTSVADVGVTLPAVDTVITSDIGIHVTHSLENSSAVYYRLGEHDIKQRQGRTGRTNNGQCWVYKFPDTPLVELNEGLRSPGSILNLLQSGIPVSVLATHMPEPLSSLLGLDEVQGPVRRDVVAEAFTQLDRYSSNISALLKEKADAQQLSTNDGRPATHIDNARMGLVRMSTLQDPSNLVSNIVRICGSLAKASFLPKERAEAYYAEVRRLSLPLLGNIKCKQPFPDPDLGEWGMSNDLDSE